MNILKTVLNLMQDWLVPEDRRVQKLLDMDPGMMRLLLPSSKVNMKDVFVLFDYSNNIVKLLVKSIKYKNNLNLKNRIAKYLYEEIIELASSIALFEGAPPILIPMPMSKIEKRNRGFNQCEELIKEIEKEMGKFSGIEVSYSALQKVRETKRQTTLSRAERELNVKNCMHVFLTSEGLIKNRTIIVLDDVYTTGATMSETRRALLAAGAKRVVNLFIAH